MAYSPRLGSGATTGWAVDLKQNLTLKYPELNGIGQGNSVRLPHFHFDNVPEEIDQPGEYFVDRDKGLLYLYPPADYKNQPIALATLAEPMVHVQNTQHISFDGLHLNLGRQQGINIKDSDNIEFTNGTVAHFTGGGIYVEGNNNRITNSHIYGLGTYGIHLNGGDKKTLTSAGNLVENNHIHDFGWEIKSQRQGVFIDGVGQIVRNKIHDGSHFAIRVRSANDVLIERNEIFDLPKYHHFDGSSLYIASGRTPQARAW